MCRSYACPECDYVHTNLDSLRIHAQKRHRVSSMDLRISLFGRTLCECGCKGETKFDTIQRGFNRFICGHNASVNNGWGHNKNALLKSQETRRGMWKRGEIVPWCKGLTKETDIRLCQSGKKISESFDNEKRQRYSKMMSKNRLDGTVHTLYGSDHSQWKGGTSAISARCHGSSHLFKEWKHPKLVAAGFKCTRCGGTKDLCVHHDVERMADIIHKLVEEFNPDHVDASQVDDWDVESQIVDAVVSYHIENNVSGVVICEACHKREHHGLNF